MIIIEPTAQELLYQHFIRQVTLRGNKEVLYRYMYGAKLTNCEKDELLICSRLAKRAAK